MVKNARTFDEDDIYIPARDLHDGLVQLIVAATMHLDCALLEVDDGAKTLAIFRAEAVLDQAMTEARRLLSGQPPAPLEEGLLLALHRLLDECVDRDELKIHRFIEADRTMSVDVELCIYRVCQEAFSNIRRHSYARHVSVVLLTVGDLVHLRVQDDGLGFLPRTVVHNQGLRNIQRRATQLGGHVSVTSRQPNGTEVVIEVPRLAKPDRRAEPCLFF